MPDDDVSCDIDMQAALEQQRKPLLTPEMLVHVNELELAISRAGMQAGPYHSVTTFESRAIDQDPLPITSCEPSPLSQAIERMIERFHRHGSRHELSTPDPPRDEQSHEEVAR